MIKFLMSIFRNDPIRNIEKEIDKLYIQSVELQRNGNLRKYADVMSRIRKLEEDYLKLKEG